MGGDAGGRAGLQRGSASRRSELLYCRGLATGRNGFVRPAFNFVRRRRSNLRIGFHRSLDRLLAHKAALEAHLSQRCGELFAIQNEVLLYDVTST